jgi:hypothetical protein
MRDPKSRAGSFSEMIKDTLKKHALIVLSFERLRLC